MPRHAQFRLDLARQVTPHLLRREPVHRWFYFQHSFSPQLVTHLLDTFQLRARALVGDPFVGAGTTLAVARQRGIDAIGADLSPLAVFVSNAKVGIARRPALRAAMKSALGALGRKYEVDLERPPRLQRAFTDDEFRVLQRLRRAILTQLGPERDILLLALLRTARKFSRAVPDGGWFRWRQLPPGEYRIASCFRECAEEMLSDLSQVPETEGYWKAHRHDARELQKLAERETVLARGCDAIISSPPYPNRHDYTRIFQVELLLLGSTEEEITSLRQTSLRSHVEARPPRDLLGPTCLPEALISVLDQLPQGGIDSRVRPMLEGYFQDMTAVLTSCRDLLRPRGHLALVVGNVRHGGVMIAVDEILLGLGESVGLAPMALWVARLRGNSAQQMGRFGREPARESVLILQRK